MSAMLSLAFCFVSLVVAGRQIVVAVREAKDVADDTSVLVYTADFFSRLLFSLKFGLGLLSGIVCIGMLVFLAFTTTTGEALNYLRETIAFFLPALAANQAAGLARKCNLPGATTPVSVRWLGIAKTWGSYYGILGSLAVIIVQKYVPSLQSGIINYDFRSVFLVGVLMGVGATWGDHLESLIKRRLGFPPGHPWWPWDQTDFAVMSALLLFPLYGVGSLTRLFGFMILMLIIHPVGNFIGYRLGLRRRIL